MSVQANLFVSYPLLGNEFSLAKKLLQESAFDTEFGREHGVRIHKRGIKNLINFKGPRVYFSPRKREGVA
jgi:hypothetical protein